MQEIGKKWRGVVLAGGAGTRLYPITKGVTKQLLPVYDKPLIYYPLATLKQSGIENVAVITTGEVRDRTGFQSLLGGGQQLGLNVSYLVQEEPRGIAEALLVAEEFIRDYYVALILGDNIFYSESMQHLSEDMMGQVESFSYDGAIFGVSVPDPQRYGVVTVGRDCFPLEIKEKPKPGTVEGDCYAVPGLYYYNANTAIEIAKSLVRSERGELEITDLHKRMLENNRLWLEILPKGVAWFDAGTFDSLLSASNYVQAVQSAMGIRVGDPNFPL